MSSDAKVHPTPSGDEAAERRARREKVKKLGQDPFAYEGLERHNFMASDVRGAARRAGKPHNAALVSSSGEFGGASHRPTFAPPAAPFNRH